MKIGVDVGTSVVKAVVFDDDGTRVATEASPTPLLRPAPGRFEYDVEQIIAAVLGLVRGLVHSTHGEIDTIAVTGQGDGLWLLDRRGRGVRPAVSWLDARATGICRAWAADGLVDKTFGRTANAPFPGAGAAILAFLDRHEPAVLDRAHTATQCQHAVFERLTGVRVTTRSCATLPLFDPRTATYDDATIALFGLERRRELLADVEPGIASLAPLRDDVAADLGVPGGAHAATGPYDLPAAALGVGLVQPGDGLLVLGTTLACQVRKARIDVSADAVGLTLCAADGGGWLRAMPAMVGTAGLDWVMRLVKATHTELPAILGESPAGARGVVALPYLSPAGERAPFAEPYARAEFSGLSLETTFPDVVRAYCEALGYAARHCFEAAGLDGDVTACGGGAASAELVQIFADILGRPIHVAIGDEPTARGAVAAADLALGHDVCNLASPAVVSPRDVNAERYAEGYARYLTRVSAARAVWRDSSAGPGRTNSPVSSNDHLPSS